MATYLHGHHESVLRSHRWRTVANSAAYLRPRLTIGDSVLDVGCGPGTITQDFARLVGPTGSVHGIDRAPDIIEQARAASTDVPNVTFDVGDLYAIDAVDDSYDVVHAHQVLQHLSDPVVALREMRRVAKPTGVVAARDADYQAMTWFPRSDGLTRWLDLYRELARVSGGEPDAGRHLLRWASDAGFGEITSSATAWCFATADDRNWWGELWADRVTESAFADLAIRHDLATMPELIELASAWRTWASDPAGWFAVLHGEVLCSK